MGGIDNDLKCPLCGSSMVKRTAKRGKNIGKEFWSCSQYFKTGCKGIININEISIKPSKKENFQNQKNINLDEINHIIPVNFYARPFFFNFESSFYQSLAVPFLFYKKINDEKVDIQEVRKYSQFRLDYKLNKRHRNDHSINDVFVLFSKLLTRGTVTLPSSNLEDKLSKLYSINNFDFDLINYLESKLINDIENIDFENSTIEKDFYYITLPNLLGDNYNFYATPQVTISTLIEEQLKFREFDETRVDFFIQYGNRKIGIELDGAEHQVHSNRDKLRDQILKNNGIELIRMKNDENHFEILRKLLFENNNEDNKKFTLNDTSSYFICLKLIHQVQIALVHLILNGYEISETNTIEVAFNNKVINKENETNILKILEQDFNVTLNHIKSGLFGLVKKTEFQFKRYSNDSSNLKIVFGSSETFTENICIINDFQFNEILSLPMYPSHMNFYDNPNEKSLKYFLNYLFRKEDFREGQLDTIIRGLQGKDSLVLLPTGAGKSIAYQMTSMLLNGITIVIDPIIALIQDQIENLNRIGIDRVGGISSLISNYKQREKTLTAFSNSEYLITFVAPERFQSLQFRNSIKSLSHIVPIPLIIIDEAHCVSEWGHDFRTSYLNIGRITRDYCGSHLTQPCLIGLTGTASNIVLHDVQRELNIKELDAIITPNTFDRKELNFDIFNCKSNEKKISLKQILLNYFPSEFQSGSFNFYTPKGDDSKCGLIFCPHVNGDYGVDKINDLIHEYQIESKLYSGSQPKNYQSTNWNIEKSQIAKDFKNNRFNLLVTTKAFGMGIDKPNINYTLHYGLPTSIESFYQEAGRAGRNKQYSKCVLLVSVDSLERANKFLNPNNNAEDLTALLKERKRDNDDDIDRIMFFHSNAFKGIKYEMISINYILSKIPNMQVNSSINIVPSDEVDRLNLEKGLYRLIVLNLIKDYTVDYSNNEFIFQYEAIEKDQIIDAYAQYVSGYSKSRVNKETAKLQKLFKLDYKEFVRESSKILVQFIYDTIEKGRRRAISEMLELTNAAIKSKDIDKTIRDRVQLYFQTTFSEEIERILNMEEIKYDFIRDLIDGYESSNGRIIGGIRSTKDAEEIRGQVARYLESYPNHPSLLMVRAISEVFSRDYSKDVVINSFQAAITFADELVGFSISKNDFYDLIAWTIAKISERNIEIYEDIIEELILKIDNEIFAKQLLTFVQDDDLKVLPGKYLINKHCKDILNIIKEQ